MLHNYSVTVSYLNKGAFFSLTYPGIRVKAADTFQASALAVAQVVEEKGEVTITSVEVNLYEVRCYKVKVDFTVYGDSTKYTNTYTVFGWGCEEAKGKALEWTYKLYKDSHAVLISEIKVFKI